MNAVETALYEALTAAVAATPAAGRVFYHPAPQGTADPLVTFQLQAEPAPSRTLGGGHIAWREYVYLVRAIVQGHSKQAAAEVLEAIEAAVDNADLSIDGHGTMLCEASGGVHFSENVGGEVYHHVGCLYRVLVT